MKKLISLLLISLAVSSTIIQEINLAPPYDLPPPPENIDELLKDFDFEKMLQELEQVFGPIDDNDLKPPAPAPTEPSKQLPKAPEKKLTQEENFIKPVEAEKTIQKIPPEKLKAFYFYMDRFINLLENMETQINSFVLGIAFKENLEDIKPTANQIFTNIKVENGRLRSKRLYQKVFFLDSFSDTRKQILETIKKLEKINKQLEKIKQLEDEEEISELLEEFDKQKDIEKTKRKLKSDIKTLLTKNLNQIGSDLEKITVSTQAKAAIEEKKKKLELRTKEAEAKRRTIPGQRSPWGSGHSSSPWGGPVSGGYGQSDWPGRTRPGSFSSQPTPAAATKGIEQKSTETPKTESPTPGFGSSLNAKEKERLDKIKKDTNESIDLLKKINTIYKPENENTLSNILSTSLLSKLASKLDLIEKSESRFGEEQVKQLEKTSIYKNKELLSGLNNFIPAAIRLAKIPTKKTNEQDAARKILTQNIAGVKELDKKYTEELSKYETTILNQITPEPLTEYDPGKKLNELAKNLQIIFTQPISDEDLVREKIADKKIIETLKTNLNKKDNLIEKLANQKSRLKESQYIDFSDIHPDFRSIVKQNLSLRSGVELQERYPNQIENPEEEDMITNAIDEKIDKLNKQKKVCDKIKALLTTELGE